MVKSQRLIARTQSFEVFESVFIEVRALATTRVRTLSKLQCLWFEEVASAGAAGDRRRSLIIIREATAGA